MNLKLMRGEKKKKWKEKIWKKKKKREKEEKERKKQKKGKKEYTSYVLKHRIKLVPFVKILGFLYSKRL